MQQTDYDAFTVAMTRVSAALLVRKFDEVKRQLSTERRVFSVFQRDVESGVVLLFDRQSTRRAKDTVHASQ